LLIRSIRLSAFEAGATRQSSSSKARRMVIP
jgi:hypothetical protein